MYPRTLPSPGSPRLVGSILSVTGFSLLQNSGAEAETEGKGGRCRRRALWVSLPQQALRDLCQEPHREWCVSIKTTLLCLFKS